ncbi:MAG: hypothetical protein HQK63_15540 [Desulfamplus sp.]|nr:hypothetical protein [Desulfamplus sp.]
MKHLTKDYKRTQHNHLNIKARLANEISQGLYPSLTRDLIMMKSEKEQGKYLLPHDESLKNQVLSKKEALQVLMKLDRDYFELFIVFDMIPPTYAEILS